MMWYDWLLLGLMAGMLIGILVAQWAMKVAAKRRKEY